MATKNNEDGSIELFEDAGDKFEKIKDKAKFMDRSIDKGIINDKTGSSVGIKNNGDVSLAASKNAQYKLGADNGQAIEISLQSKTVTNRKELCADEVILNGHKLNPQLAELSDMKQLYEDPDEAIGNLTMMGTVLVKAWEPSLGKYVLIRRQARIPIFSPKLNLPDAPETLGLDSDVAGEPIINESKE